MPLPPVLGKSLQQHDRFTLADDGKVSTQAGRVDNEMVDARCLGIGGDQAEASTERWGSGVSMTTPSCGGDTGAWFHSLALLDDEVLDGQDRCIGVERPRLGRIVLMIDRKCPLVRRLRGFVPVSRVG